MYRDADYDVDDDVRSTASCFVGLKENGRFLPNAHPKVRRTSSVDDISRFQRHYQLARRHCGRALTWRHYATLLHDGFRHFKPLKVKSVHTLCSTSTMSERSAYATAPESEASSYYSMKKVLALSNLRRCCLQISTETKHLARELVRRVDRVLHLRSSSRSTSPPCKAKRHGRTAGDSPNFFRYKSSRGAATIDATSSDSASSTPSIRPPCGAGDQGTRKRPVRVKDKRHQQRRP